MVSSSGFVGDGCGFRFRFDERIVLRMGFRWDSEERRSDTLRLPRGIREAKSERRRDCSLVGFLSLLFRG